MAEPVLTIRLLSDSCFGATQLTTVDDVDTCQAVDALGIPYIGGRLLKGLLVEETAVILRTLGALTSSTNGAWIEAARLAFGEPKAEQCAALFIGNASFSEAIRNHFREAIQKDLALIPLATKATTIIRRQTRIEHSTGAAAEHSLRSVRLLRRGEVLTAPLRYQGKSLLNAPVEVKALVAVAARLVRRGGLHRTRGWGHLDCSVTYNDQEVTWQAPLIAALQGVA